MQCLKFTSHATPLMKLFEEIPHQNERIYQEKGKLDVRTNYSAQERGERTAWITEKGDAWMTVVHQV